MDRLEHYFKMAEAFAKQSPCLRRQYGCAIVGENTFARGYNQRVSKCCGDICVREAKGLVNGERVELGAEIHAETAALINWGGGGPVDLVLVGFMEDKELYGTHVYPCHTCALNIKYAGFRDIFIRKDKDTIISVPIGEIIEHRESEWFTD